MLLPTIATKLITQELTKRGFTNVEITLGYPSIHDLTISSLAFHTPAEPDSHSFTLNHAKIKYSIESLLNKSVEAITIEHIRSKMEFLET